jgi:two-component system cell cycle response regulator DivK
MPLSLLLLEPHRDSREMYVEFLEYDGFVVRTPATVAEAVTLAPTVDAVVTEITVAVGDDGLQLVRQLRRTPSTRSVPIVVLTANAFKQDAARAQEAGCDLFLAKPCVPADLANAVRRAVAWRRSGSPRMIKFVVPPSSYRNSG